MPYLALTLEKAQPRRRNRSLFHDTAIPLSRRQYPYPYHISPSSIVADVTNASSLTLRSRNHHRLLLLLLPRRSLRRHFLHRPLLLLTLIKSPHTPSLLRLNPLPRNRPHQLLKHWIWRTAPLEEPSLPLPPLSLLLSPQLPLRVLDLRFFNVHGVHVGFHNRRSDFLPRAVGFVGVLLVKRGDD